MPNARLRTRSIISMPDQKSCRVRRPDDNVLTRDVYNNGSRLTDAKPIINISTFAARQEERFTHNCYLRHNERFAQARLLFSCIWARRRSIQVSFHASSSAHAHTHTHNVMRHITRMCKMCRTLSGCVKLQKQILQNDWDEKKYLTKNFILFYLCVLLSIRNIAICIIQMLHFPWH